MFKTHVTELIKEDDVTQYNAIGAILNFSHVPRTKGFEYICKIYEEFNVSTFLR